MPARRSRHVSVSSSWRGVVYLAISGFRVDPHPAGRFNRGPVNGVELPGGAQRDRLGADLKDADLSGQHLDCWFASAAHKRIVIGKARKKPRAGPGLRTQNHDTLRNGQSR